MRYGLNLPNGGVDPQTLGEFAALAEKAGWDGSFSKTTSSGKAIKTSRLTIPG